MTQPTNNDYDHFNDSLSRFGDFQLSLKHSFTEHSNFGMEVLQRDETGLATLWQRTVQGEWVELIQTPSSPTYPRNELSEAQSILDTTHIQQALDDGALQYLGTIEPETHETLDWIVLQRDDAGHPTKVARLSSGTYTQIFDITK